MVAAATSQSIEKVKYVLTSNTDSKNKIIIRNNSYYNSISCVFRFLLF